MKCYYRALMLKKQIFFFDGPDLWGPRVIWAMCRCDFVTLDRQKDFNEFNDNVVKFQLELLKRYLQRHGSVAGNKQLISDRTGA